MTFSKLIGVTGIGMERKDPNPNSQKKPRPIPTGPNDDKVFKGRWYRNAMQQKSEGIVVSDLRPQGMPCRIYKDSKWRGDVYISHITGQLHQGLIGPTERDHFYPYATYKNIFLPEVVGSRLNERWASKEENRHKRKVEPKDVPNHMKEKEYVISDEWIQWYLYDAHITYERLCRLQDIVIAEWECWKRGNPMHKKNILDVLIEMTKDNRWKDYFNSSIELSVRHDRCDTSMESSFWYECRGCPKWFHKRGDNYIDCPDCWNEAYGFA